MSVFPPLTLSVGGGRCCKIVITVSTDLDAEVPPVSVPGSAQRFSAARLRLHGVCGIQVDRGLTNSVETDRGNSAFEGLGG